MSIIKENKRMLLELEKLSIEMKKIKDEFYESNINLNIDLIYAMSVNELKSYLDSIEIFVQEDSEYKLPAWDKYYQVFKIYEEKRIANNPEMLKANYYPAINGISFISDKQKYELDKALFATENHYFPLSDLDYIFDEDIIDSVALELVKIGIVNASIQTKCHHCEADLHHVSIDIIHKYMTTKDNESKWVILNACYGNSECEHCSEELYDADKMIEVDSDVSVIVNIKDSGFKGL